MERRHQISTNALWLAIPGRGQDPRALLRRFARDERGTILIFSIYAFVLILMVGGIGIDLMRFERDRTQLQYTLDRAVLAAADLDQTLDPKAVVTDYFDKAGLTGRLTSVTVEDGLSYRSVSARATSQVKTQFMHMTGLRMLNAPAAGAAEERIDGLEISLILDVSGSMNRNNRLPNLKIAAKQFVDTMVANSEDGKLSLSIVPYATQVSAPANFLSRFTVSDEHGYSNCVNFDSGDFARTSIDPAAQLTRTMHFDVWSGNYDGRGNEPMQLVPRPICEARASREMLILQKDPATLKSFIDALSADGNTSIDLGMKWGTALLDPSLRPAIAAMIEDGDVPAAFGARPLGFHDDDTLKVIVLMTDGENTRQYFVDPRYRSGASDIWWNAEARRYSVYNPDNELYFWPHAGQWADHPYGKDGYGCVHNNGWQCATRSVTGDARALGYADLWARTSVQRNVRDHYAPWMNGDAAWNRWYYDVRHHVGPGTKNARTKAICDAAKGQQVIVYTIGFEAPANGQAVLRDCASSPSHYFDVDGLEIADAFASIASSIRQLRLTQ